MGPLRRRRDGDSDLHPEAELRGSSCAHPRFVPAFDRYFDCSAAATRWGELLRKSDGFENTIR